MSCQIEIPHNFWTAPDNQLMRRSNINWLALLGCSHRGQAKSSQRAPKRAPGEHPLSTRKITGMGRRYGKWGVNVFAELQSKRRVNLASKYMQILVVTFTRQFGNKRRVNLASRDMHIFSRRFYSLLRQNNEQKSDKLVDLSYENGYAVPMISIHYMTSLLECCCRWWLFVIGGSD